MTIRSIRSSTALLLLHCTTTRLRKVMVVTRSTLHEACAPCMYYICTLATRTCSSDPTYRDNTLIYASIVRSKNALYKRVPQAHLLRHCPVRARGIRGGARRILSRSRSLTFASVQHVSVAFSYPREGHATFHRRCGCNAFSQSSSSPCVLLGVWRVRMPQVQGHFRRTLSACFCFLHLPLRANLAHWSCACAAL